MQDRGTDEPGDVVDDVSAAEDLTERPHERGERDDVADQMQRRGSVGAAKAGDHAG
jgi:hypothetical protein